MAKRADQLESVLAVAWPSRRMTRRSAQFKLDSEIEVKGAAETIGSAAGTVGQIRRTLSKALGGDRICLTELQFHEIPFSPRHSFREPRL